nr:MAG TPA: hypothetical protein [Caudoviricetes sp.]
MLDTDIFFKKFLSIRCIFRIKFVICLILDDRLSPSVPRFYILKL